MAWLGGMMALEALILATEIFNRESMQTAAPVVKGLLLQRKYVGLVSPLFDYTLIMALRWVVAHQCQVLQRKKVNGGFLFGCLMQSVTGPSGLKFSKVLFQL